MHPNDFYYDDTWHLTKLGNIEKIWDEYSGAGIHIGIYDAGIQSAHPDLGANIDSSRAVTINGNPVGGEPNATTPDPHGTAVAGILAAVANNGVGVVGVAWGASLTSVPIIDPDSSIYLVSPNQANFLSAVHQMANFDVTNNSWNATLFFEPYTNLAVPSQYANINLEYEFAVSDGRGGLGTVIVQGVGNDNRDAQGSGVNASRYTISVAAIEQDGFAADFSNHGACVLVTAPGVLDVTTDLTGIVGYWPEDYVSVSGTSFATPIVSGIAALMLQANANLGWRDVQNILAASTTHTGSAIGALTPGTNENGNWFLNQAANWNGGGMHFSNDYGYGVVNAYNAVRMAEVWSLFQPAQVSGNERTWFNSDDTDRAIAPGATLQTPILLTPAPAIKAEHIELTLELTHTDYTKLRIFLVSPDGTETQLYDGSAGTDATSDAPFKWTYATDALRGENASGNWTVRIENTSGSDSGTLSWFEVGVYGQTASANDVYHYTDEFLAMAALLGGGGRTVLSDASGIDWIDAAAVTGNFVLNLAENLFSTVNGVNWFKIAPGTVIEKAVTGDGNDVISGNAAGNVLYGMRGNDVLDGGLGGDTLHGGTGSDVYVVDNGLDIVDENGGDGVDTVQASINFSLANAARVLGTVENLTLTGGLAVGGTGTSGANTIAGNGAANILTGNAGVDRLIGGSGNDTLSGGAGNDTLTGGLNNDFFLFNTALAGNRDTITDYNAAQDTFRLENAIFTKLGAGVHPLSPLFFRAGAAAADANDYIVYNKASGALFYDVNGSGAGGAIQFATLTNKPTLTAGEFAVV
jgi:Ca2+-binding RTX toxin-like protein